MKEVGTALTVMVVVVWTVVCEGRVLVGKFGCDGTVAGLTVEDTVVVVVALVAEPVTVMVVVV